MNTAQLRDVDLNLLVVLDALLRERSVTQAAERLHLTPSAVSHALRRLRALLGDELLVRDGRKMVPTVRAENLAETLPRLLAQIARTIEAPEAFDAASSRRAFRLAAPDFVAAFVPTLLHDIQGSAPGVKVVLVPYTTAARGHLADGRLDAMISRSSMHREDLRPSPLGSWPWEVYGRPGHPAFENWSVDAWSATPHLQVRLAVQGQKQGPSDLRVAELGVTREVRAEIPHFTMAGPILLETDLLLTSPSISMRAQARTYGLDRRPVPFDLPELQLSLYRSAVEGDDPAVRWFLGRVESAFKRHDAGDTPQA